MKYILFLILLFPLASFAQQALKLDEIMAGNDYIGHQPNSIVWGADNQTVYFNWRRNLEARENKYSYSFQTAKIEKIETSNIYKTAINGYKTNSDKSALYFQNNDRIYFCGDQKNKLVYQSAEPFRLHQVINRAEIIIRQNQSYYLFNHSKGVLKQCISFDASNKSTPKDLDYLQRQQIELFQFIREQNSIKENRMEIDSIQKLNAVPKFNTNGNRIGIITFNHTASFTIFRTDKYPKNKNTEIEANITESGYSKKVVARPKVGGKNPNHQLFWMDLKTKMYEKIDLSALPGIMDDPKYLKIYDASLDLKRQSPKATICTQIKMNTSGSMALLEIKSYDNKDRWIVVFSVENKTLTCLDHQHDDTWIGGPGISGWNMVPGNIGWLKDDNTIYYQSEKTGYSHLYTTEVSTKKTTALTKGNFEIYTAELSKDGNLFFISANKTKPGNKGFYHVNIKTKKWTTILDEDGNYQVEISPDEDQLAIRYSYNNKPWELYIAPNSEKASMTQITESTSENFKEYNWREPKIVTFKNQKGKTVYARLFIPENDKKNNAAIQFVHGAGYLQNAHNWWSVYYREYMFHNLLCDLGYTVIDIDYSASEGYGRDFRTSIYRHMGGQDLDDQIAGRQYLIDKYDIDPNKVGMYGGSYGGFITIMALLKYPGYFQCGAAIRSVTDWAHYNHAYTSNILNTPETDSIAFRRSSPIYFAENLKDELLILHGMMDDNVQFQDVVRLNQRFIELGKQNFTMALYPIEPHGFVKTSSWVDEYNRILRLFDKNLTR